MKHPAESTPLKALLAAAALTAAGHATAATGCPALGKAGQLAQAQARIHAVSRSFFEGETLAQASVTHSVVIGTQQTLLDGGSWSQTKLDMSDVPGAPKGGADSMRTLAANLIFFDAEMPCKALGRETLAGRSALVYEIRYEVNTGEANGRIWLDAATGLPLKMVSRQRDFDARLKLGKDGKLAGVQHTANNKFMLQQHAWLFGESVKDIPRSTRTPDAAAQAQIDALLR
jgi:hypothetical protein